ncbi:hypothetical protein BU23DRAFT_644653 [Bimuria novae-zelandiae CBS 107.79]|uniref:Uncharacterized protein n=1 Tax=Bimuria novae-zelandiae CBS 107.79 TaxID=1447943 RepID=A0A6A5V565_9PLEO|nr:hypothetical protein BU23DRAFT_644653 [Bimuria novae-zelandiae CBS 107.79]
MSARKRPAADTAAGKPQAKRPRPAPKAQLRLAAGLRPAQAPPVREVISISSTSPDPQPNGNPHDIPSGGIFPTDSFQNVVINSVEVPPTSRNKRVGLDHYIYLNAHHPHKHVNITSTFDAYRTLAPDNVAPGEPHPDVGPQYLDLGDLVDGVDYARYPAHKHAYSSPLYEGRTSNPLVALAILHIATKNLPSINFTSAIAHLPNVGPQTPAPRFPPHMPDAELPFLDTATQWTGEEGDQQIMLLFLPNYYVDERHAVGFYTRKAVSGRLCHIVFTPCTTQELSLAGLLDPVDPGLTIADFRGYDVGVVEGGVPWEQLDVGVKGGEWLDRGNVGDRAVWENAEDIVGVEWVIRVRIAVRAIHEEGTEAGRRDGGNWADTRWD